jgi:hypothetical protein
VIAEIGAKVISILDDVLPNRSTLEISIFQ